MRKKTLLYIGLGAAVLYWLTIAGQRIAASFEVKGVSFRFGKLDLSGIDISIPMQIQNNTALSLPLNSFRGRLVYGNTDLAPVLITNPVNLEAQKITTVNISSRITFFGLAAELVELFTSKQKVNDLRLIGTFDFKGVPIPLDYPITIV